MNILAISYNYPHVSRPYSGIFVKGTLVGIAKLGHNITVIAPQKLLREEKMPFSSFEEGIQIFRPTFVSFGAKRLWSLNSYSMTQKSFQDAVLNVIIKENVRVDVVYSHFLLAAGYSALKVANALKVKALCVIGESNLLEHEAKYSPQKLSILYNSFDGLIFNSFHTKEFAENRYNIGKNISIVINNGVDTEVFFPKDKTESRAKLGLADKDKIVIFVGSFIERKGPLRVLRACELLPNPTKMIFIGGGSQWPKGVNVLFSGTVDHSLLPDYLSAADAFVLPTLGEGMPNAVIEAMACNLPIVTSPIEPNIALLGENYPLFCNPLIEEDIADKIYRALELGSAQYLNIPNVTDRARLIVEFISMVSD